MRKPYSILSWIVVVLFLVVLGPPILWGILGVLTHPLGCPDGESPQGDRYDYCEPNGLSYVRTPASEFPTSVDLEKLRSEVDWPAVQGALR